MMLAGGDFVCDLDVQRDDVAGAELRAVPAITLLPTFIALVKRFDGPVFEAFVRDRERAGGGGGRPRVFRTAG
jgi:hypothetical protein